MYHHDREANKPTMALQIDANPTGRRLTPAARQSAIDFAAEAWQGNVTVTEAVDRGIAYATRDIFKDNGEC